LIKKIVSGFILALLISSMLMLSFRVTVNKAEATLEYPYSTDMPVVFIRTRNPTPSTLQANVSIFHLSNRFYTTDTKWNPGDQQLGPYVDFGRYNYTLGNLYAFDMLFSWNPSVLSYVSHQATVPVETYSEGVLHSPVFPAADTVDPVAGTYRVAYTSNSPAPAFNAPHANATVFTITFDIIDTGSYGLSLDSIDLATDIVGFPGVNAKIPYRTVFLHDVAVRDIKPVKTGTDPVLDVNVTIQNQGDFDETCSVTLYANGSNIGTVAGINIMNRAAKDVTISWDTTSYPKGTYNMTAVVSTVPGETDTSDNTYTTYFGHDVAVTDIKSTKTGTDPTLDVNVTVQSGDFEETFDVSLYANGSLIGTITGVNVKPRDSKDITFNWDTSGYTKGTYNMTAVATTVTGETDTGNNVYTTFFVHDVSAADIDPIKTIVGQDYPINISVTVSNPGDFEEIFNVTFYVNGSLAGSITNINLKPKDSEVVTFIWDTTGYAKGNYYINATIASVAGETHTIDNTALYGWILVSLPGDVDGDHDVDIFDIVSMAGVYGVSKPDPQYDPYADIDNDGDIDIFDIVAAAGNYGQSW